MAEAIDALRSGHGYAIEVDGRGVHLVEPVKGDPGNAVLRALGAMEDVSPVGAAAHGPAGVAVGVWRNPELYLARWTKGSRWVVAYRLVGGSLPNHYVRTEGRIPTRFETGSWYGKVPDQVDEAFLDADLLLDDPPFPVPAAPPPPPAPPARTPRATSSRPPSAPRPPKPAKPAPAPRARPDVTRLCPSCSMHKRPSQFVESSDLCVDCR